MYGSGRIVLIGANRETQLVEAVEQICSLLCTCVCAPLAVANYVFTIKTAACNLNSLFLKLKQIHDKRLISFDYTPELFPALICHYGESYKATIFRSGKINIIGCRRREEGRKAVKVLCQLLYLSAD